jgi:hypothetical protein
MLQIADAVAAAVMPLVCFCDAITQLKRSGAESTVSTGIFPDVHMYEAFGELLDGCFTRVPAPSSLSCGSVCGVAIVTSPPEVSLSYSGQDQVDDLATRAAGKIRHRPPHIQETLREPSAPRSNASPPAACRDDRRR